MFYHIVRETSGTGGVSPSQINNITDYINQEFNPNNIYFNSLGHDFINVSSYLSIDEEPEAEILTSTYNRQDAINIYIVDNLWGTSGGEVAGTALDIPSLNVVISRYYFSSIVLVHELGHCLNLLHTHETARGVENIDGSNCGSAGDFICDTPADPKLLSDEDGYLVDLNCNYTGGGGYNPDTRNIMSYSRIICLESFTIGQEIRIRDALYAKPILQNIFSTTCEIPKITGDKVTCNSPSTVYTIENADPPYVWDFSTNLQMVENNGNSITVIATDPSIRESGFIEVTYNGGVKSKTIWVGKPIAPTSLYGPELVNSGSWYAYHGGGGGATSYEWRLPFPFDINEPVDQTSDNWQMNPTTSGYNSNIWSGNGGISGLVQLIGINKCGIGGSRSIFVEHDNTGGPCTTCNAIPPSPIPNTADENFKLDFTSYPEGIYYIYIYDQYSNIMYEGESGNIDKTVETINIPNGVYYLHIHDGNEVITKQLIINH